MSVEPLTTILLIDDSITDRTRSVGLLRKADAAWDVIPVSNADDALKMLGQRRINVVISDVVMPGIDGRQLLKIMGTDYPMIPAILISSQQDDQVAAECIGLGAVNYVSKEKLAEKLGAVVKEVLKAEEELVSRRRVLEHVVQNRFQFEIENNLDQIRALVNYVRDRLLAMQVLSTIRIRNATTAVRECLLNAYFHGNLQVNSRPLELTRTEYMKVASVRQQQSEYANRRIRLAMQLGQQTVTFRISDDGQGFDHSATERLTGPPSDSFSNGNGIRLMRALMESVDFNASGTEVALAIAIDERRLMTQVKG
ncbi:MAG: response regulator [Fuerstiella sp.]